MAACPVLKLLGISDTVDWSQTPLSAKLQFACGTPAFLDAARPLLKNRTVLSV
jgi:myo-inositol-1(or 4)-monophosphatase